MSTCLCQAPFAADVLPAAPGTYALVISLPEPRRLGVGALGMCEFAPGVHIYVGSAHGPGGLRARVMRHLRAGKLQHWHIDYLTACAMPMQIIWEVGAPRRECEWLQRILALPGAYAPISGFGSSDCLAHCPAHLVALSQTPDLANTLCLVLA